MPCGHTFCSGCLTAAGGNCQECGDEGTGFQQTVKVQQLETLVSKFDVSWHAPAGQQWRSKAELVSKRSMAVAIAAVFSAGVMRAPGISVAQQRNACLAGSQGHSLGFRCLGG